MFVRRFIVVPPVVKRVSFIFLENLTSIIFSYLLKPFPLVFNELQNQCGLDIHLPFYMLAYNRTKMFYLCFTRWIRML